MKNLIYGLLILSSVAFAHDYEFTDKDGFVKGSVEDNDSEYVIRDNDGFEIGTIDSTGTGTIRDNDGFEIGTIE